MTTNCKDHLGLDPRMGKENSYEGHYQENCWNMNLDHGFNNSIVVNVKLHDFDYSTTVTSDSVIVVGKYNLQHLRGKKLAVSPMYLKLFLMN